MFGKISSIIFQYVPAVDSLRRYSWQDLGRDAVAGVTVATVAVPQAMAYALIAGIHPQYGLYTAIVMTFVGALFDSSRLLINGPTNAISIALFSAVAVMPDAQRVEAAVFLAFLVGLIQIGITLFRLGDLTRYVSHGVIVGFMLGAAVLIFLGQIKNLLGLHVPADVHDHFLQRFWNTIRFGQINWPTAAVGIGTIAVCLALRYGKKRLAHQWQFFFPEFLLSITLASAVVVLFQLNTLGVAVVGPIPSELPGFAPPTMSWTSMRELSGSALAISVLGLLEAIAMAKAIAAKNRQKLDINQQCLSEGVANFVGGFFQCFPGSGSLTRSTINQQTGAVSQWAAVISSAAVALMVVLLARFAANIPYAALAGLLMISAWRMIDRTQVLYHLRTTRFDAWIVIATALAAVFISVEFCILIGVFLSFVLYVPRAAKLGLSELIVTPERVVRERTEGDPTCDRLLIYNLEGELFFGAAPDLDRHFETISKRAANGAKVIILRCKNVRNADAVCLSHFGRLFEIMAERQIHVLLCGVRADLLRALRTSGLARTLGIDHIFPEQQGVMSSTLDAVRHGYELLRNDYCDICPKRGEEGGEEPWYYMI